MDVEMPVMNGNEAAKKIRDAGIDTPIIAMTANILKEEIADCMKAGMNGHISKPFVVNDLKEIILKYARPQ